MAVSTLFKPRVRRIRPIMQSSRCNAIESGVTEIPQRAILKIQVGWEEQNLFTEKRKVLKIFCGCNKIQPETARRRCNVRNQLFL